MMLCSVKVCVAMAFNERMDSNRVTYNQLHDIHGNALLPTDFILPMLLFTKMLGNDVVMML